MTLRSVSLFVGTGQCNARCGHCAGVPLRKYAPNGDGIIDEKLIYGIIKTCFEQGARYLSISSSGEPTLSPLSVTKTLELVDECKKKGINFNPINLYSNGMRIGEDKIFCDNYLPMWRRLGLTTLYVTIHNVNEQENARIYGVKKYPPLDLVISRIHEADLLVRANIVLSKRTISTLEQFVEMVEQLENKGIDYISAWPIRNNDDKVDKILSPREEELDKIEQWVEVNQGLKGRIRLLREKSREAYETGQKLTLFPDGTLSNMWCNY